MPEENAPSSRYFSAASLERRSRRRNPDQHVGGDGHQFEADEDENDIEAGGHAHHAGDRKQHQRVVLAVIFVLGFEVAHRHEDGDGRGREEQIPEIEGEVVDQHGSHACQPQPGDAVQSTSWIL